MLPRSLSDLNGLSAAAFVRVSTDQQQMSPATQRRTIERFAAAHSLNIVRTVELTISGRDAWRDPAVIEITQAVENGQIRAVIVSTLDRMGRSPRTDLFIDDLTAANAVLIDAGNELISGNAAHRRAMRTGIATAGNERDLIRERVTSGIADRFEANGDPWGRPAEGFTRTGGEPSLLQIDPVAMAPVVALFERYAPGTISIADLARESGRNENTLKDTLGNRVYNGWVQHKGNWTPAPWRDAPPVSDTLYEAVQRTRTRRTRAGGPRPPNRVNLFEGLFYCGPCDAHLIHNGFGGTNPYQRIKHNDPCEGWGPAKQRPVMLWVEPLIEQLTQIQIDDQTTTQIVSHLRSGTPTNLEPVRFRQEKQQVSRDLIARKISGTEAETRLTAIDQAEQAHRAEASGVEVPDAVAVTAALSDLRRTWLVADDRHKAAVINAMYEKVRLGADGTFPEDAVTLSAAAEAIGLPLAMPTEFGVPERTRTSDL